MSNKNIFTGPEIVYTPTSQRKDAPKPRNELNLIEH